MVNHGKLQKSMESEGNNSVSIMPHNSTKEIWDVVTSVHPNRNEIFCVVRVLNGIGVNPKIIGACLNFQKWKTFFGSTEWAAKDVHNFVEYLTHKTGPMDASVYSNYLQE